MYELTDNPVAEEINEILSGYIVHLYEQRLSFRWQSPILSQFVQFHNFVHW